MDMVHLQKYITIACTWELVRMRTNIRADSTSMHYKPKHPPSTFGLQFENYCNDYSSTGVACRKRSCVKFLVQNQSRWLVSLWKRKFEGFPPHSMYLSRLGIFLEGHKQALWLHCVFWKDWLNSNKGKRVLWLHDLWRGLVGNDCFNLPLAGMSTN